MALCGHVEKDCIAMLLADVNPTHDKLKFAAAVPWRTTIPAAMAGILFLHRASNTVKSLVMMVDSYINIKDSSKNQLFLTQCLNWRTRFCSPREQAKLLGKSNNALYSSTNSNSR